MKVFHSNAAQMTPEHVVSLAGNYLLHTSIAPVRTGDLHLKIESQYLDAKDPLARQHALGITASPEALYAIGKFITEISR